MSTIIDRRVPKSHKNSNNRKKFIERNKGAIKRALNKQMKNKKIKDLDKPVDLDISDTVKEYEVEYDTETGESESVISGNEHYIKGELIPKPPTGKKNGNGAGGAGEDDFYFTLTKEEFYELYFDDMDLPNFIKESKIDTIKYQVKRAGYVKDGLPVRLDIKKTLEMALARKLSNKDKKAPFIDDIDLRYRHYKPVPIPMRQAVIFFLMDVSGSVQEHHKSLSKKFFIFLYLFLTKNYEKVQVRFIRYHHNAREVDEETFFYGRDTGGTIVMEPLKLVSSIIQEEYASGLQNIYIAHTADGDFSPFEEEEVLQFLPQEILPYIQYYAYLQVMDAEQYEYWWDLDEDLTLLGVLGKLAEDDKKLNVEVAIKDEDIFPVLHNLFKKGK